MRRGGVWEVGLVVGSVKWPSLGIVKHAGAKLTRDDEAHRVSFAMMSSVIMSFGTPLVVSVSS